MCPEMIKKIISFKNRKRRLVATSAVAAAAIMLVASIATIGAAPLSVQQQGTGQAPGQRVTSSNIVDGEVRNQDLADNAVTSDKIANGEVTSADIEDGTITSTDIAEGTIPPTGGGNPPANSVTSATIVDETIASEDIGEGQVATADLANGAVTTEKIASDAIQLTTHRVSTFGGVAAGIDLSVSAFCPSGEILTGGGYGMNRLGLEVISTGPDVSGRNIWTVHALNPTQSEIRLDVFAVCAQIIP
jgi:hypothetical protein